jgi:hypothetical protein
MRSYSYVFALLVIFLVLGAMGSLLVGVKHKPTPPPPVPETSTIPLPQTTEITPPPSTLGTTTDAESLMITVSAPLPNTKVTSPLQVTGSARGMWYFEASFPIRLVDAKGNIILQTHAQAQGEWMTENFVPFTSTLTWSSTSTTATSGVLIFMRDNPSGLPENDAEVRIPITF